MKGFDPQFAILGDDFDFENFLIFVRNEIVPYLEMPFVEENKLEEVFNTIVHNQYSAQQIHRGWGKTETGIWLICYLIACKPVNPHSKIKKRMTEGMIITSADDALGTLSARLKYYFYVNPRLAKLLPNDTKELINEKKNQYWNGSELYFNNDVVVHLRTILSKSIRGNHNDWVWGDDLVGENSALVDKKIEDVWFSAVDGTTTAKNALTFITGTPKRLTDVMQRMNESKGYYFKKYPIINENDEIISLRWNMEKINETRERIGSVIFQCEYMLNPIDDGTCLIRPDWIKNCFSDVFKVVQTEKKIEMFNKQMYKELGLTPVKVKENGNEVDKYYLNLRPKWATAVYLGVDFAFSDRLTADKSCFTIVAEYKKDKKYYYVILDQINKKGWSGQRQLDFIKEINEYYKFNLIGLEENSIKAITDKIKDLQLPIRRFWTGSHDEKEQDRNTYKPYKTVSKVNLILRLGTMFENQEILIPHGDKESIDQADILFNECISFSKEKDKLIEIGVHPDNPIALAYALEVSQKWNASFIV